MNTDQELLEKAAKAAGILHVDYTGIDYDGLSGLQLIDGIGRHTQSWNPINDDGDALRLAVKLKLWTHSGMGKYHDQDDPYAAPRLAIVRGAAAIGEAMPPTQGGNE